MPRKYKSVIVEHDTEEQKIHILTPEIGIYYRPPEPGLYLSTGSLAGLLKRVNNLYHLRIPENVSGFVQHVYAYNIANPVEYKEELFYLVPGQSMATSILEKDEVIPRSESDKLVPEGVITIRSPTDGIFYRRPSPDLPPYVEEGDQVTIGQILGLVEVMKSFNQIKFWGPDFPQSATVVKILAEDNSEIKSMQHLFWLKPIK